MTNEGSEMRAHTTLVLIDLEGRRRKKGTRGAFVVVMTFYGQQSQHEPRIECSEE